MNNDYHCFFNDVSRKYQGAWSCEQYCDVNGRLLARINSSTLQNCYGASGLYETEAECLSNSYGNPIDSYYPQGGANNCVAYDD